MKDRSKLGGLYGGSTYTFMVQGSGFRVETPNPNFSGGLRVERFGVQKAAALGFFV